MTERDTYTSADGWDFDIRNCFVFVFFKYIYKKS